MSSASEYQKPLGRQWEVVTQALENRSSEDTLDELITFWDLKRDQGPQEQREPTSDIGSIGTLSFLVRQSIKHGAEQGKRSETIASVLTAMHWASIPEGEIIQCFEAEKIGEKYREKGHSRVKWLQGEIERIKSSIGREKVEAWPEPGQIKAEMLPVEELREEMVPAPLWPMIADVSHRMAVPADYVAIPLIIVIGSVIGTGCRIKPKRKDDWSIVPNLWGGISGPPSRLKTPAMDEILSKTLGRLETESGEENSKSIAEWQKGQRAAKMNKAVLENEYKKALKDERKGIIQ